MPDLKSELISKVVGNWDAPKQVVATAAGPIEKEQSYGVSRAVFETIKANPGRYTPVEATSTLAAQGYKSSSVSALMSQSLRQGRLEKDAWGKLRTTSQTYTPLQPYSKSAAKQAAKPSKKVLVSTAEDIVMRPVKEVHAFSVEDILATINVRQAHELYVALRSMFV